MFGLFTPFFYLPSYAVSQGMSAELASFLIAILNASSFFGRVVPGVLGDKFGRVNIFFFAGIVTAVMIFCFTAAKSNAQIIVSSSHFHTTACFEFLSSHPYKTDDLRIDVVEREMNTDYPRCTLPFMASFKEELFQACLSSSQQHQKINGRLARSWD